MKTEMRFAMNGELTNKAVELLRELVDSGISRDELIITHPKGNCTMPYSKQDIEYNPKYFEAVESVDNTFNYVIAIGE